jgi:hypothetical protein
VGLFFTLSVWVMPTAVVAFWGSAFVFLSKLFVDLFGKPQPKWMNLSADHQTEDRKNQKP